MRRFFYLLLFASTVFFYSCPKNRTSFNSLKEIHFKVSYSLQYTEQEKENAIQTYNYNQYCLDNNPIANSHLCKDLKTLFEQDIVRFKSKFYCYDIKKDKESIFKENIKAKLYDKEENILAEDYLRCDRKLDGTEDCRNNSSPHLNFYLPYSKKAHKIKVIKEQDGKEIILNEKELLSYEEIRNGGRYSEHYNCHTWNLAPIL